MTTGVYLLTGPSGKQYVGKSWSKQGIKQRWNSHKNCADKSAKGCRYLYAAIRAHGWDNFKREIIHVITHATHGENWKTVISEMESMEIRNRNTLSPNGYNLVVGFNTANIEISDETRKLMSDRSSGEKNPMYGKPRTEEVKEKLRRANTGKKYPPRGPEYSAKMSELNRGDNHPMYGKKHREESKKAIGDAIRGRVVSAETREKMSASKKGRIVTEETRSKSRKPIEQWSKDGANLIETFASLEEAYTKTGVGKSGMSSCANTRPGYKTAGGFVWKFSET
jgi:group I intron endonuclease